MWAREWFETARNVVIHREFMRERVERMRASVEGGAVRYDGVPGGGTGDGMLSIVATEAVFAEEDAYTRRVLDAANELLFGDDGAARARGHALGWAGAPPAGEREAVQRVRRGEAGKRVLYAKQAHRRAFVPMQGLKEHQSQDGMEAKEGGASE